jgi:endo-1,3(4)-beta-glucanase
MTRLRPRVLALVGSAVIVAIVGPVAVSGRLAKPDRREVRAAIVPPTGRIGVPEVSGKGSIAPELPEGTRPASGPAQAGEGLVGRAVPTNQWWTSALTGPWSQPMYAHPLAIQAAPEGIEISASRPTVRPNSIESPFEPTVRAGGPSRSVRVVSYGAFSVRLESALDGGGRLETTLVQGSPIVYLRFLDTDPRLTAAGPVAITDDGARARVTGGRGQRFDVVASGPGGHWEQDGGQLRLTDAGQDRVVAVAAVPDKEDRDWPLALARSADNPVTTTAATSRYDGSQGQVVQQLRVVREREASGLFALLPHQQRTYVCTGTAPVAGSYLSPRGTLRLVEADTITLQVPMPGLLPGWPLVPASSRPAVARDLAADLAQRGEVNGGSYFGFKELGRLATVAELAERLDDGSSRRQALQRLRSVLVDWLTYTGKGDAHYFGYEQRWGGLVAVPAEFGSQDYNDHHFQYGYLVRAAAVLARADHEFVRDYGAVVDLVVRDYAGGLGPDGFPNERAFSPYLGHSLASGFANFASGNNQESSSEAVAAWEAVVRWGGASGQPELVARGTERYALEALTARTYWLGEGITRPAGYTHRTAGIVWDAKLDFATWFDAKPESIVGIQLLPLTFGSLYRSDPTEARRRAVELARAVGGQPRAWGDLFAADLATADPAAAGARLTASLPRESSTSRAMTRSYVALLAAHGRPDPTVTADSPYGHAFSGPGGLHLVAVNATSQVRTVTFRRDGQTVGSVRLDPDQARTVAAPKAPE